MNRSVWLSAAGISGPIVFISLVLIGTVISPWFSWEQNALSDIGVHSQYYLFNYSIIYWGICLLVFSASMRSIYGADRLTLSMFAISGLSLIMVGIFNENFLIYHVIFAFLSFFIFPLSIFRLSASLKVSERRIALIGYTTSSVALAVIIVGLLSSFGYFRLKYVGLAVPEIIFILLVGSWSVEFSICSLRSNKAVESIV